MNRLRASRLANSDSKPGTKRRILLFVWVALLSCAHRAALGFRGNHEATDAIESFFFEAGATVPALHYAAFAYVLWNRRFALAADSRNETRAASGYLAAGLAALLGLLVFAWSQRTGQLDLLIDSMTLWIVAGALWLGGWKRLGQFALPLAILWLARPWPPMLIHSIHFFLQTATADIVEFVLAPFGEWARSGHLLAFRGQLFHVIEGCSGFRSTMTLIFGTLVYADLFSRSRRQTLGLVALAAGLGLVVNVLRVLSIMLDPTSSVSQDHSIQGIIMIVVGVLAIAGIDMLADRWLWPKGSRAWRQEAAEKPLETNSGFVVPIASGCLLVLLSLVSASATGPAANPWQLHLIPSEIGDWRQSKRLELDREFLGSVDFRDTIYREYTKGDRSVRLFIGSNNRRRRDKSGLSPKTRLPGRGWEIASSDEIDTREGRPSIRLDRIRLRRRGHEPHQVLVFHFRIGSRGPLEESLRWLTAYDLRADLRVIDPAVVRIDTPIVDGNQARAQEVLISFLSALEGSFETAKPTLDVPK